MQHARTMLRELGNTVEYGRIIWEHLSTQTYDRHTAITLFQVLRVAEATISSIAKSLLFRQSLSQISLSPLTEIIKFYAAPEPRLHLSNSSVQQQIIDFKINPGISRPYYWNNYFAPIFLLLKMSTSDHDDDSMQQDDGDSSDRESSVVSHSKQPSKQRRQVYSVADTSVERISELIAIQLENDRSQAEVEQPQGDPAGFISASDTIQPPSTQENLPLWTYRLSLYRRRNAASTSMTMLDLFKSFATELFHKDKQASILLVSSRHTKFSSITSVKEIPKVDLGRMRLYFSP